MTFSSSISWFFPNPWWVYRSYRSRLGKAIHEEWGRLLYYLPISSHCDWTCYWFSLPGISLPGLAIWMNIKMFFGGVCLTFLWCIHIVFCEWMSLRQWQIWDKNLFWMFSPLAWVHSELHMFMFWNLGSTNSGNILFVFLCATCNWSTCHCTCSYHDRCLLCIHTM